VNHPTHSGSECLVIDGKRNAGFATGFSIRRRIQIGNRVPRCHSFNERRVDAANETQ
jgi:hypothetical protein